MASRLHFPLLGLALLPAAACTPDEDGFAQADDDSAEATPSPWTEGELLARDAHASWVGGAPGDRAGTVVAAIPDLNGDGLHELVFGAPDRGASNEGGACVVFSNQARVPGPHACGDADATIQGVLPDGHLGASATWTDLDLDGDGVGELVLGAPGAGGTGALYFVSSAALTFGGLVAVDPLWSLSGTQSGGEYGAAIVLLDDLDGDGARDLAIGSPGHDGDDEDEGQISILASGTFRNALPTTDGVAPLRFRGTAEALRLGAVLSDAGDLDGDGFRDLAAGLPTYAGGATGGGGAFLFRHLDLADASGNQAADSAWIRLESPTESEQAGMSLAGAGDTDGDGLADLWVGAPLADWEQANGGGAYLVRGSSLGAGGNRSLEFAYARVVGSRAGAKLGSSIAGGADLDGDGSPDAVFGGPEDDIPAQAGGVAQVWSGTSFAGAGDHPSSEATLRILPEYPGQLLSSRVAFFPDLSGDGRPEVLVASPDHREGTNPSPAGKVFLILSP